MFGPDGSCVTVALGATAHRIAAELRAQVSGDAHPYFARNTGTRETRRLRHPAGPATIEVRHPADQPTTLGLLTSG